MPDRLPRYRRSEISSLVLGSFLAACGPRPTPAVTAQPVLPLEAPPLVPQPDDPSEVALSDESVDPGQLAQREWMNRFPEIVDIDPVFNARRWFYAAKMLADRELFAAHFETTGFKVKRGSLLLVTQIAEGVDQPRYYYFSLDDTGWAPAPKYFVPASTVKLMASLSALWTLSTAGLDGDTTLRFRDIDGPYRGSAYKLYKDALLHSSNQNYNRLMEIAGFDAVNTEYLTAERGFPVMRIQSRYGALNKAYGIRVSPPIRYTHEGSDGELPKRKGEYRSDACRGNCTTLFELQDIMRRVMLHDEIPTHARFPVARVDLERIQGLLLQARNRLQPSPDKAFGEEVQVYNEVGRIPGRVLLENAYLYAPASQKRLMLALSLRFPIGQDPKRDLQELARVALEAALPAQPRGPGLQWDAGVEMELELRHDANTVGISVSAPEASVDEIEVWEINQSLPTESYTYDEELTVTATRPLSARETLFVAIASKEGLEVGYRSWRVMLEEPKSPPESR